ncbi:MAG: beta-aspartyl-peptidase [Candidatus Bipolaricaulota bacterium]|nr:beta-aspartyl-peptidase [Candidatus Bipolaricaulota bacterium]MDW8127372.1 beta-aspartyl-peptidase [Candidatus Bipolaricaulota bacterium]
MQGIPGTLFVRNANVFTPKPLGLRDLLVVAGKIILIGKDLGKPPWVEKVLDCAGGYLVPGLIDLHVHLQGGGGEAGPASRLPEVPFSDLIQAGITTCVGCLGTDDVTRSLAGLLAKARALQSQGITAYIYTGSYRVPPVTLTGSVRRDLVLIPEVIGVGEIAISDHRSSQPTLAELARLAAEARVGGMLAGKRGLVHLHLGSAPSGLAPLRELLRTTSLPITQFHPTHVNRTPELLEEAAAWVEAGGTVDLTAPSSTLTWDLLRAVQGLARADPNWERFTISSDGGGSMPKFDAAGNLVGYAAGDVRALWRAIQALVRDGIPLEKALRPVTVNPARILGLSQKGEIAVGNDADFLVLDENLGIVATVARGTVLFP